MILNYINWHCNPEIFRIGSFAVRWYGLFFAMSFFFGYVILARIFKKEGHKIELLDKLTIYMVVSTIVGARLGHCLFYQPDYYMKNLVEILYIWEGGLASHGAAIGILLGLFLFYKKVKKVTYLWVLDRVVIVAALSGMFIRGGNLTNSEIFGKPADVSHAFIYQRVDQNFPDFYAKWEKKNVKLIWRAVNNHSGYYKIERKLDDSDWENIGEVEVNSTNIKNEFYEFVDSNLNANKAWYKLRANNYQLGAIGFVPRYPTQIYEALSYLLIFIMLLGLYYKKYGNMFDGFLLSIFLISIFGVRFILEFFKEVQVPFENALTLNMGQLLSIPFVIIGVLIYFRGRKRAKMTNNIVDE